MKNLKDLREQIDGIDRQIVELYQTRMEIVGEVAEHKIETGKKVFDKEREESKLKVLSALGTSEFCRLGIRGLYEHIMSVSRKQQYQILSDHGVYKTSDFVGVEDLFNRDARIVMYGEEACMQYSVKKYFGENAVSFCADTLQNAMEQLQNGRADYALLLSEHSSLEIYDFLAEYDVCLVSKGWEETDRASHYGLEEEHISHYRQNENRYMLVAGRHIFVKSAGEISVCFESSCEVGDLSHILSHFIYNGIHINRITSKMLKGQNEVYRFFLDFDGNLNDAAVQNVLCGLADEVDGFQILGNYEKSKSNDMYK